MFEDKIKKLGAGSVALVVEFLPSKPKSLNSNLSITTKIKNLKKP
jgi:hypothetical protein